MDEREQTRDQNEDSGQQPTGQQGQQPTGHQGQQPLGQQADFGNQAPEPSLPSGSQQESRQSGGQSATGQASEGAGAEAAVMNEGAEPDLGGDVGPGGYSPTSGASDLGGGETGLGDSGGFVGTESEDSGDYLQQDGNPQAGFAEQGRGAANQGDVERSGERSENRDSDIEGGSGSV